MAIRFHLLRSLLLPGCLFSLLSFGQGGFRVGYDTFFETVQPAANGDLLFTQDVYTGMVPPFVVMRTDSLGAVLWASYLWTEDQSVDVVETAAQDILVATNWTDSATQRQCPAVVALAADGTLLWSKYFICDTVSVRVGSMVRTSDGANILAVRSVFGNRLKALIRMNDSGQVIWARKLSNDWNYQFDHVVPVENGAVLVLDRLSFYNAVMKVSATGQLLWMNEYDLNGNWLSKVMDAVRMPDGDYRLLLRSAFVATDGDMLVVHTTPTGALVGNTTYTFPDNENVAYADMEVNSVGDLVFAVSHGNGHEIMLHTDAGGAVQWVNKAIGVQIFGGDVEFVDDQHFLTVSGAGMPNAIGLLFRSDTDLTMDGCFDPYSVVSSSTAVSVTPLSYSLITPSVSTISFTPAMAPLAVAASLPCTTLGLPPVASASFTLSPNPAANSLHVELAIVPERGVDLLVLNALGARVLEQHLTSGGTVDVSALEPGIHFVRLIGADQEILGQAPFIKE